MKARKEEFSVVCAYDSWGYNETNFFIIRNTFIESQPEYWEFLNPGTLMAYFLRANDGRERASKLLARLEELKRSSSLFSETGIGHSEGECITSYDKSGSIDSPPIGDAVSHAMHSARTINRSVK